jgi:hypothetical protein
MSSALASLKEKQTRPKQSDAGVGATLAYNEIIRDVLPPIVAELEKKIVDLEAKVDAMKRPAGSGLAAVRGISGGRRTRRNPRT